jgi:hypothetical protein
VPTPLLLYPEAVSVADLNQVVNAKALSDLGKVVAKGPRDTYMASMG